MTIKNRLQSAKINLQKEIKKHNLNFVLEQIESPLKPICDQMTKNGFTINKVKLENLSKTFHTKINKLEKTIFKITEKDFNIKSTQQLSKILFEELEIPSKGLKKTPKGVVSTKESELLKLQGKHEIIDLILEYRELTKMLSTYVDNLLPMLDSENKLHPDFLQLGTSTGRFSSKNPNIQNIPTSGEYGSLIREVFVSSKNYKLFSFDYSQIELRIAALLSKDKKMIETFKSGNDIHSKVAVEIFGEETKETRRKAKVVNFGILYGMGVNSLKKNLNEGSEEEISISDARKYLDSYFEKFNGLSTFIEKTKEKTKEDGFTTTLFGRKRFFPEINSKAPFIRAMAERMAVNAPIQGTAADIIKLAMVQIYKYLKEENLTDDVKMLAQVHDELIFEIKKNTHKEIIDKIENIMKSVLDKEYKIDNKNILKYEKIPLEIHVSSGDNWSKLK